MISRPPKRAVTNTDVLRDMMVNTRQSRDGDDHCQLTLLRLCDRMLKWKADDRPLTADLVILFTLLEPAEEQA
ncbi:MAG: hypothetical protein Q9173_003704, partial [Seirophora scorigena]